MRVTIIGAGLMGRGIGTRLVAGGNDVELIDSDPEDAHSLAEELSGQGTGSATASEGGSIEGEVVILAIPFGAAADAIAAYGDRLAGKVIIDITNPVDFASFEGLVVPRTTRLPRRRSARSSRPVGCSQSTPGRCGAPASSNSSASCT